MANLLDIERLRAGYTPSRKELIRIVCLLSAPTIMAELCSTAMQYIDAGMVGSLGADATAAIGLVESATWLTGGLCTGTATGFSVQIAQHIGSGNKQRARNVLRQAILVCLAFGVLLGSLCVAISGGLPVWLSGEPEVCKQATSYFAILAFALPAVQFSRLFTGALQCSGDTRTPSYLNILMCVLDIVFNVFFIFPGLQFELFGLRMGIPGLGLGVAGAALGTATAEVVVALLLFWATCFRSHDLALFGHRCADHAAEEGINRSTWRFELRCLKTAATVGVPIYLDRIVMNGAQIALISIVAPLGTVALAANSLAVTAEAICYMPGFGISTASTTLVGQCIGARRQDLARRFARATVYAGMAVMTFAGALMFFAAPLLFALLTPVVAVQELGVLVLRIELFSEPLFGASIVVEGALRGAGDTLVPTILGMASMWGVRVTLAAILAPMFGLVGVWVAMLIELCVRGILFLVRLYRERWLQNAKLV